MIIEKDDRFINDYFIKIVNNDDFTAEFIKIMFKFIKLRVFFIESYINNDNIKLKRFYLNINFRDAIEKIYNISLIIVSAYFNSYINSDLRFNIFDSTLF